MRKSRLALTLGGVNVAALMLVATLSAGDASWGIGKQRLPEDAMPISEAARLAEDQHLGRIHGIAVEDGHYVVKAVDAEGRRVTLTLDPATGAVLR
jgi:uncharacterized membrane protein YkoI